MNVLERVAYLRGLYAGLEIDNQQKEGKLWTAMLDTMEEMAQSITDLQTRNNALVEELDGIYEELSAMAEDFLENSEEDGELYQVICPTCDEVIYLDDDALEEGAITCPSCGEELEFDLSDLDKDEDSITTEN